MISNGKAVKQKIKHKMILILVCTVSIFNVSIDRWAYICFRSTRCKTGDFHFLVGLKNNTTDIIKHQFTQNPGDPVGFFLAKAFWQAVTSNEFGFAPKHSVQFIINSDRSVTVWKRGKYPSLSTLFPVSKCVTRGMFKVKQNTAIQILNNPDCLLSQPETHFAQTDFLK